MGKRKSKARVLKKERPTVPKLFDCIFCNHAKTVEAKLNHTTLVGTVACRICDAKYQVPITSLTEPVDVYHDWIDETDKLNRGVQEDARLGERGRSDKGGAIARKAAARAHSDDDEDDDD